MFSSSVQLPKSTVSLVKTLSDPEWTRNKAILSSPPQEVLAHTCRVWFFFLPWGWNSPGFDGKHPYLQSFHQPSNIFETVFLTEPIVMVLHGLAVPWIPGILCLPHLALDLKARAVAPPFLCGGRDPNSDQVFLWQDISSGLSKYFLAKNISRFVWGRS